MLLNLSDIIHVPGGAVSFECQMDFSGLEFFGVFPVTLPVTVKGEVKNTAGILELTAAASTVLSSVCDRCAAEFENPKTLEIRTVLAEELESEENDDIILLEGDCVNIGAIIETAFILSMDTKTLCSPDCKGLCPSCGANLNEKSCGCAAPADPRLAVLKQLLEDK